MFGGFGMEIGLYVCFLGMSALKENVSVKKKNRKSRRTSHEYSGNDNSDYMYNLNCDVTYRKEAVMK